MHDVQRASAARAANGRARACDKQADSARAEVQATGAAAVNHTERCTCDECERERDKQAVLWALIVAALLSVVMRLGS